MMLEFYFASCQQSTVNSQQLIFKIYLKLCKVKQNILINRIIPKNITFILKIIFKRFLINLYKKLYNQRRI